MGYIFKIFLNYFAMSQTDCYKHDYFKNFKGYFVFKALREWSLFESLLTYDMKISK